MIRRGFWLTAGAVTGIYGYRRVSAIGRRLSGRLNPASLNPARPGGSPSREVRLARAARRGTVGLARETYRFTRDVREGMGLYMARHSAPAGSTLGARDALGTTNARPRSLPGSAKTNQPGSATTNDDPRPKDGH